MLNDSIYSQTIQPAKCPIVQNGRERLAEYIARQMEAKNWSYNDVARASGSFKLSNGTIWNLVNLRVKDVKENTLRGLAKAFSVPETEVLEIYYGRKKVSEDDLADDEEIAALFYKYKNLTDDEKRELRRLLRSLDREIDEIEAERKKKRKAKA